MLSQLENKGANMDFQARTNFSAFPFMFAHLSSHLRAYFQRLNTFAHNYI